MGLGAAAHGLIIAQHPIESVNHMLARYTGGTKISKRTTSNEKVQNLDVLFASVPIVSLRSVHRITCEQMHMVRVEA